ncbi:MAG: hypothetical protein A2Y79_14085 [Deltaproteobacteria bacterium RBG_13_43_22]|nr:MAG: hypothetical protein A2Y79_14085 [Deltaproteobacteria bacterium RBG_13_43_22]
MKDSSISTPGQKRIWSARLLNMLARRLTHPWLALHLSVVAVILTLPALWVGLQFDDYSQRMTMLGFNKTAHPGPLGFLDVYSFLKGNRQINEFVKNIGMLPWWAPSDLRISFFRPLNALSLWIDYKLWPDWPSLMHLQSILWYAALAAAAASLYRRFMGLTVVAGLAALFFAVDYSHAMPVAWLANRHALLAAFFGILCLLSYDKWRQEGKKWHGVLCPAYLALALLSGEMAVAVGAYLFSYALFLDRQPQAGTESPSPLLHRLWALWPCVIVFLSWALVYRSFGYGTHGSGMYVDPLNAPVAFAQALMTRAPLLLLGQWSTIFLDTVGSRISEKTALIRAFIFLVLLAFILVPLIRKDRVARFWFTGMILSIVPVAAAGPSSRLLLFIGIGAMGLLAQCLILLWRNDGVLPISRFWRIPATIVVVYLVLVRLVLSPPQLSLYSYVMKPLGDPFVAAAEHVLNDPEIAQQELIMVNPSSQLSPWLIWYIGITEGKRPAGMRVLSVTPVAVEVYRIDENSIRVHIPGGLFKGSNDRVFRSLEEDPISINQEFQVTGMTARVTAMNKENGPEEIVYHFSVPLEDKSLKWLQWKDCGYKDFLPPSMGQSVLLPAFNPYDIFRNGCTAGGPVR